MSTPSIGNLVARLALARAFRMDLAKDLEGAKAKEALAENAVQEALKAAGITEAKGGGLSVRLSTKNVPLVDDWQAFYAYVAHNGAFDLLHRRVSATACAARWEVDETIPGVSPVELTQLDVRALKGA